MSDTANALALSKRILAMAEELLKPMDREMERLQWRPEFRAVMWDTVAQAALRRLAVARGQESETVEDRVRRAGL